VTATRIAQASLAPPKAVAYLGASKIVGIVSVVAVVATGVGWWAVSSPKPTQHRSQGPVAHSLDVKDAPTQVASPAPSVSNFVATESPAPSVESPVRSDPSTRATPSTKASGLSVHDEVVILDSARQDIDAGNSGKALEALDRYFRLFPKGVLRQESSALRIEALVRAGRLDEAKANLRAFDQSYPSSPQKQRLHSLVEDANQGAKPKP
jgi:TolA-binding protein